MLIYTDKKKIKRQKIKRIAFTLIISLLFILNIYHFQTTKHQTSQTLTQYTTLKTDHTWYNKNLPSILFSSPQNNKIAILLPQNINEKNSLSIAKIFSQTLPSQKSLHIDNTTIEKDYIYSLAKLYNPNIKIHKKAKNVYISSNFDTLKPYINKNKLTPSIFHTHNHKLSTDNPNLLKLVNQKFPPQTPPLSKLDKEEQSLKTFLLEYKPHLISILNATKDIPFNKKNELLKNTSICLITKNNQQSCSLNKNLSLIKNLTSAQKKLPSNSQITKIFLLTSFIEIPKNDTIYNKDVGLFFEFENRQSILLPHQANTLLSNQIIPTLKTKANINPKHNNENMKLYQFKAVEINANDNI